MISDYINKYITAKSDLSISVLSPGGSFYMFDSLRAGEKYPVRVHSVVNLGGTYYFKFMTSPDSQAFYPGSNYTYIPFIESAVNKPETISYVKPPEQPGVIDKAGTYIKTLFIIGAGAYVLASFFGRK